MLTWMLRSAPVNISVMEAYTVWPAAATRMLPLLPAGNSLLLSESTPPSPMYQTGAFEDGLGQRKTALLGSPPPAPIFGAVPSAANSVPLSNDKSDQLPLLCGKVIR